MSDDSDNHNHQATAIPYIGPEVDADALRELANEMEAGRVQSIAVAATLEGDQVAHYYDWTPGHADVWSLLGALDYLCDRLRRSIAAQSEEEHL